jgi:hypothetical protein
MDIANGMSVMQCIDPANYDIRTGRMAYSYCWRYACLPDVFATTRFSATVTDLDRFNIQLMEGEFQLAMQRPDLRTEGVDITVVGERRGREEE